MNHSEPRQNICTNCRNLLLLERDILAVDTSTGSLVVDNASLVDGDPGRVSAVDPG